jgi:hypothetical protein
MKLFDVNSGQEENTQYDMQKVKLVHLIVFISNHDNSKAFRYVQINVSAIDRLPLSIA